MDFESEMLKISNDRLCNAYKNGTEEQKKGTRRILREYYAEEARIEKRDSFICKWIIGIIVVATLLLIISFFIPYTGPPLLYLDLK